MKALLNITLIILPFFLLAQGSYAPNASTVGTDAIHKDSAIFVGWATNCSVTRGFQNITDETLGYASAGNENNAIGKAGINGIVSLGDHGEAILTFNNPIINGDGSDFAVFENSFNDTFLELAFVEVSTDGINYVRFPAHSETQDTSQIDGFGNLEARNLNNLAGKYRANFGTPFDLEELIDSSNIDIQNINYIKVIDVVGAINNTHTTFDYFQNQINDPFPTPYASSGFDLDAVGVIHQFVGINETKSQSPKIYPNPSSGQFTIEFKSFNSPIEISIYNISGILIHKHQAISVNYKYSQSLPTGVYLIETKNAYFENKQRLIVR